ncbi:MAG: esterase family protein [Actinomycetota bacterium]|nr:esterase family protein [Actinomycetota bacterium]
MELTDSSFIVLLAVLALGVFGVLVAGLPRRGTPLWRGVGRGAQVLVLNVLVVTLCGAALNDQYLFYSSWSDLLGARSPSVQVHRGGTSAGRVASTTPGPGFTGMSTPAHLPPLPAPGSRLQTYTVVAQRSNAAGQVLVYLPVGYDPASPRTYPVMLGLHGFPSGPTAFLGHPFTSTADTLASQHQLASSIVVMPRIDTPATLDTECVNGGPGQPQTDTWLSHDIPAWVTQHFRVERTRSAWAAVGYSYGAWCAASITLRHPDVFGAAIVLQGYFRPDFSSGYDPLTPSTLQGYDLVKIARTAPPPVAMWILASRADSLSYPTTSAFLSAARPPLDVSATVLATGGHRSSVFEPYIPVALRWLGQTLPGFRG